MTKYNICGYCGKEYNKNDDGAGYKYCSKGCSKDMRRKRNRERWRKENPGWNDDTKKKCENCNEWFEVPARNSWIARYCGYECRYEHKARANGVMPIEEHLEQRAKQKKENEKIRRKKQHKRYLERLTTKECVWCGEKYETDIQHQKVCSRECRRKRTNSLKSLSKEDRIPIEQVVDRDISLGRLYKRDGGVCYLCNQKCDYSDVRETKEGFKYSGPRYPSVDHVMPVAHGGLHAWNNVRLAHTECNVRKSDEIPESLKELLPKDAYSVSRGVKQQKKETLQFDLKGNLIARYESTTQAAKETGIPSSTIQNNARGQSKVTRGKYVFRYAP